MDRRFLMAAGAVLAVGCTTTLEPIGNVGGHAGEGGTGAVGGAAGEAGHAGMAGFGGYAGEAGFGAFGGIGGVGGGAIDGGVCDDGNFCTIDVLEPDGACYHYLSMEFCGNGGGGGIGGVGGYAGEAGFGGYAGEAGYGGYAGEAGYGGYAGMAGFGGVGGAIDGGMPCDDGNPCTYDVIQPDGACYHYMAPDCGNGGYGGYAGEAGFGGVGGYAGEAGYGGMAGVGGYGAYGGGGGIGGVGGYAGEAGTGGYAGEAGYGGMAGVGGYGAYGGGGGIGGCGEMGFDSDGDGYTNTFCGNDCDDTDADAYPWQTSFFTSARNSGGYDYDCDGEVTLRWGELHTMCSPDMSAQSCVGSGWTAEDAQDAFIPGCGQSSQYAFCQFTGNGCAVSIHVVTQACR